MNRKEILRIITNLSNKRAPSGLENLRGEVFEQELKSIIGSKEISIKRDEIGNIFVKFKGKTGKKAIAILAHLDEIGGTIRYIKKNGNLEFSRRGGYEGRWLISQNVKILNKDGVWINGIIAGRSAHAIPEKSRGKESFDPRDLEIYIGASNKDEVLNHYKVHVGAPFVFSGEFGLLNPDFNDDLIAGYSMDNLAALTCLIVLADKIINEINASIGDAVLSQDIYLVATTREEIGTEGAYYFVRNHKISKVIAIDIGIVEEDPKAIKSGITLKGGPVIVWQDSLGKCVYDYNFCKNLMEIAEKKSLSYQNGVFERYGSDAGKTQQWLGIPSALIGIPVKFSHNVPEICTLSGIKSTAELIFQYLKEIK